MMPGIRPRQRRAGPQRRERRRGECLGEAPMVDIHRHRLLESEGRSQPLVGGASAQRHDPRAGAVAQGDHACGE